MDIVVFVVGAVTAFGLNAVEPVEDVLKALPSVVGAAGDEAGDEIVIGEAEDGATVLNLAAEGNGFGMSPAVGIVINVAASCGAGAKLPVIDIRTL